uniref:Uncharacterized protein n=1 Tax=Salix viminalis TaxID=40686 RepID=A0A6N2LKV7_SALVM
MHWVTLSILAKSSNTSRASEGFSTVTGFCEATWIHEQNVCNRGGLLGLVSEDLSDCSSKSSGSRLTVPSDQVRSSQLRSSVLSGPLYSDHVVRRSIRYFDICSLCEIW